VVSITGSSAGAGFYYYYYNWEVRTAPCSSAKIPVIANVNVINNNAASTNRICTANNGTATVAPTGGSTPYTYIWSNGRTTATNTGLNAGTYTVTATDAIGCRRISTVTVSTTSTTITSTNAVTARGCVSLGSATVTTTNGTAPYTFLWSNGRTTAANTGLAAGNYTVTITDANGCLGTNSATVANNVVTITSTSSSVAANCALLGSATITTTNGTAPYTFLWSNGRTTATNTGLNAGTYTVTITDANGCLGTNSATVANNVVTITSTSSSVAANCAALGSATVTTTNGTAPYTFLWSNGRTTAANTGLAAGNYTVTITDANGCLGTNSATVANNGVTIAATINSTDASCGSANGSATVTATNGVAPYSFLWSDGQNAATASNLAAGNYTVTITDANGCLGQESISIANQNGPSAVVSSNNASCNAANDGSATVSASGGAGTYTYLWSDGQSSATAINLAAGNYTVSVSDSNGCLTQSSISIGEPSSVSVSTSNTAASVAGAADGAIDITVSGGTAPYSFIWSNGNTTEDLSGVGVGSYTVTVTDANGCLLVLPNIAVQDGPLSLLNNNQFSFVNLYPNPTDANAVLDFSLASVSDVEIRVVDALGRVLISKTFELVNNAQYQLDVANWPAAIYMVQLISDKAFVTKPLIITRR
jgi:hypothetical protein